MTFRYRFLALRQEIKNPNLYYLAPAQTFYAPADWDNYPAALPAAQLPCSLCQRYKKKFSIHGLIKAS